MNTPDLHGDEVHLWWADCDSAPLELESLLDEEERQRATRFRVEAARQRYVAARSISRLLLASYTQAPPSSLVFTRGARGKPRLESPQSHPELHFNSAHSGNTVALALATVELGADVETLRPVPNYPRLAARFCSQAEREPLMALPEEDREAAFLALWTCKEAYLKAVGSGIAMALRQVEVSLAPPRLIRINNDPHVASAWTLLRADLPEPAVCTVAIRGTGWRLITRRFPWPARLDR